MWAFYATAALLTAGALLFVLPPLLRRPPGGADGLAPHGPALALAVHRERMRELDAEVARGAISAMEHARERFELERRVAEELPATAAATTALPSDARWVPWVAALGACALALGVYGRLGQPGAVAPAEVQAAADGGHAMTQAQMLGLVDRLATRLKSQPEDADGWHMLARSYVNFARYPDAVQAYERAAALQPGNPNLLADYADVLAMTQGRNLDGRPLALIQAALKAEPRHAKALALAGTAAFNRKDYAVAIGHWRTLQGTLAPESDGFKRVAGSIADAQARLVGDAGGAVVATAAPAPTPATDKVTAGAAAVLSGTVALADALQGRLAPGGTLFVFARAEQGPRMPLAIVRVPADGKPFNFTLDDSQAMAPQAKLSLHTRVMLGARISASGNATPQSGDLMGTLGPVAVGTRGLRLVIDGVVP